MQFKEDEITDYTAPLPTSRREQKIFKLFDKALEDAQSADKATMTKNINLAGKVAAGLTSSNGIRHVVRRLLQLSKHSQARKETAVYAADSILNHMPGINQVAIQEFQKRLMPQLKNLFKRALKGSENRVKLANRFLLKHVDVWQARNWFNDDILEDLALFLARAGAERPGSYFPEDEFGDATPLVNLPTGGNTPVYRSVREQVPETPAAPYASILRSVPSTPMYHQAAITKKEEIASMVPKTPAFPGAEPGQLFKVPRTPVPIGTADVRNQVPMTPALPGLNRVPSTPGPPGLNAVPATPARGGSTAVPSTPRVAPSTPRQAGGAGPTTPKHPGAQPMTPGYGASPSTPHYPGAPMPGQPRHTVNLCQVPTTPGVPLNFPAPRTPMQPFTPGGALPTRGVKAPFTPRVKVQPAEEVPGGMTVPGTPMPGGMSVPATPRMMPQTPAKQEGTGSMAQPYTPGNVQPYTPVPHMQEGRGSMGNVQPYTPVPHMQEGRGSMGYVQPYTPVPHIQEGRGSTAQPYAPGNVQPYTPVPHMQEGPRSMVQPYTPGNVQPYTPVPHIQPFTPAPPVNPFTPLPQPFTPAAPPQPFTPAGPPPQQIAAGGVTPPLLAAPGTPGYLPGPGGHLAPVTPAPGRQPLTPGPPPGTPGWTNVPGGNMAPVTPAQPGQRRALEVSHPEPSEEFTATFVPPTEVPERPAAPSRPPQPPPSEEFTPTMGPPPSFTELPRPAQKPPQPEPSDEFTPSLGGPPEASEASRKRRTELPFPSDEAPTEVFTEVAPEEALRGAASRGEPGAKRQKVVEEATPVPTTTPVPSSEALPPE